MVFWRNENEREGGREIIEDDKFARCLQNGSKFKKFIRE